MRPDPSQNGWTVKNEQVDECSLVAFPIAAKDYIDFNPDGTKPELRFIDTASGIDLGFQDLIDMYNYVADTVIPAFADLFPIPDVTWHFPGNEII